MSLQNFIYNKLDKDRLIPLSAWIFIGILVLLSGLLLSSTIFLMGMGGHSIDRNWLIPVACLSALAFLLLIFGLVYAVRRTISERQAHLHLLNEHKTAATLARNLIDRSPIGFHSVDKEGRLVDINQTELDWLGYEREEVIGRGIDEIVDEDTRLLLPALSATFQQKGILENIEIYLIAKNGHAIPTLLNSKALYNPDGTFAYSLTTTYNFTERKKLEIDLIAARQEAENARYVKRLFMANMSHEIRTPLNAILGFTNVLINTELGDTQREYVQNIQTAGTNLLAIANDILDFEKIRSGMLRIEQVEFDLPGLLHSLIRMEHNLAREKHLNLVLDAAADLPHILLGDPMRLTQILMNLLSNAIKFTDQGSITLRVRALAMAGADEPVRIRFEVQDTGIGIPKSEHSRIFERFIQASSDTTRKYGGTGLGLALVKMLVDLQQGSLDLVSQEGYGSTFGVEIPYQFPSTTLPTENSFEKPEQVDLHGYHVLLVEDNPMNQRIAELNLSEYGLAVSLAANGLEAVESLRARPAAFDLVLMDIQMPEMDGYTATRLIRSELGLTTLPIIALTAHVLAGEREKVLACGMNDYLTKPLRPNELITTLLRYLPGFWDAQALYEFTRGKPAYLQEIVALFIQNFPEQMDQLQQALQAEDFAHVATIAHSLRSTVSYAGFQSSLGKLLLEIETIARSTPADLDLLVSYYTRLARDSRHAVVILQREMKRNTE